MNSILVTPQRAPSYEVTVGTGISASLGEALGDEADRIALISDDTVAALYAKEVEQAIEETGRRVIVATFPAGEGSKSRVTKALLEDQLLSENLGRDGLIVALGGGVTIDLAGFVAATYMRGIPFMAVPTSLLAMVDASVGGKTGLNVESSKNVIGAFHQPRGVIVDLKTLQTLPERELRNGLAEMAKHALISGQRGRFGDFCNEGSSLLRLEQPKLENEVVRSIEVKADIVAKDTNDVGIRAVLNLGHTIGHGIESVSKFSVPHGFALSIGLVCEAFVAHRMGLLEHESVVRIRSGLEILGLPVSLPQGVTIDSVVAATQADKKARGGVVRYSLLASIGSPAPGGEGWTHDVSPTTVRAALEELE